MFRTKILLVILLLSEFTFAQDKSIDSLKTALQNQPSDTNYIKTLNALNLKLMLKDAVKYKVEILNNFKKVESTASKLKLNFGVGSGNFIVGRVYDALNLQDSVLIYFQNSVKAYEKDNNYQGLSRAYQGLGRLYFYAGNLNECYKYCDLGLNARIKIGDQKDLGPAYMFKAVVVQNMKDSMEAAGRYYKIAIDLEEKFNSPSDVGRLYNNYGSYLSNLGQNKEALLVFSKSVEIGKKIGDSLILAFASFSTAQVHYRDKNFKKAKEFLLMPIRYWTRTNHFEDIAAGNSLMSQCLYALGDYKLSMDYMNRAQAVKDSIFKLTNIKNVNELEAKFEVEKKDKELSILREKSILETLEKEKQQNRNTILLIGIVVLIILGVIVLYAFINKQKANKLLDKEKKLVEAQRNIVEAKNKEILDSISYAKRIQTTQLTSEKYIDKTLERLTKN